MRIAVGVALLASAIVLQACGSREELRPAANETLPVAPVGAPAPATPEDLMTPSPQAAPQRSDEPLRRSEERQPDPFELPPPG